LYFHRLVLFYRKKNKTSGEVHDFILKTTNRLGDLESRTLAPSLEGRGFQSPIGSNQRLRNWRLLLPWIAFTI